MGVRANLRMEQLDALGSADRATARTIRDDSHPDRTRSGHHPWSDTVRLRPADENFYQLFTLAADNLVAAADVLAEFVRDKADRPVLAAKLRDHEHAGDSTTHQILRRL